MAVEKHASSSTLELTGPPPSVTDRYYTKFFSVGEKKALYVHYLYRSFFFGFVNVRLLARKMVGQKINVLDHKTFYRVWG